MKKLQIIFTSWLVLYIKLNTAQIDVSILQKNPSLPSSNSNEWTPHIGPIQPQNPEKEFQPRPFYDGKYNIQPFQANSIIEEQIPRDIEFTQHPQNSQFSDTQEDLFKFHDSSMQTGGSFRPLDVKTPPIFSEEQTFNFVPDQDIFLNVRGSPTMPNVQVNLAPQIVANGPNPGPANVISTNPNLQQQPQSQFQPQQQPPQQQAPQQQAPQQQRPQQQTPQQQAPQQQTPQQQRPQQTSQQQAPQQQAPQQQPPQQQAPQQQPPQQQGPQQQRPQQIPQQAPQQQTPQQQAPQQQTPQQITPQQQAPQQQAPQQQTPQQQTPQQQTPQQQAPQQQRPQQQPVQQSPHQQPPQPASQQQQQPQQQSGPGQQQPQLVKESQHAQQQQTILQSQTTQSHSSDATQNPLQQSTPSHLTESESDHKIPKLSEIQPQTLSQILLKDKQEPESINRVIPGQRAINLANQNPSVPVQIAFSPLVLDTSNIQNNVLNSMTSDSQVSSKPSSVSTTSSLLSSSTKPTMSSNSHPATSTNNPISATELEDSEVTNLPVNKLPLSDKAPELSESISDSQPPSDKDTQSKLIHRPNLITPNQQGFIPPNQPGFIAPNQPGFQRVFPDSFPNFGFHPSGQFVNPFSNNYIGNGLNTNNINNFGRLPSFNPNRFNGFGNHRR